MRQSTTKLYDLRLTAIITVLLLAISFETPAQTPIARLTMSKGTFSDECVYYFQVGGDTLWQSSYDAYKLIGPTTSAWVACLKGTVLTGINGLPALPMNLESKVKAISTTNATYTFSLVHENFPNNVCVQLYDTYTQQSTNILSASYVCQLYDTTTVARFRIRFYTSTTSGNAVLTAATCAKPTSAMIAACGIGSGPWNYAWFFQDSLVKQSLQVNSADTIVDLPVGIWKVKINPVGTCLYYAKTFTVNAITFPVAKFEINHPELNLAQAHDLILSNSSRDGQTYQWNFGDGSACSSEFEPTYLYSTAGEFNISLTTTSSSGCIDSISKSIKLNKNEIDVTGILVNENLQVINLIKTGEGQFRLMINVESIQDLRVSVRTLDGSLVDVKHYQGQRTLDVPLILEQQIAVILVEGERVRKVFRVLR